MNQFKHAFKGVLKDKLHSILNIIGFAVGLACSIIVFLYIQNVLNYEKHHKNYERIYRYGVNMTIGDVSNNQSTCNMGVGPILKDYMPGIENYLRIGQFGKILVKKNYDTFYENDFIFADSSIFNILTYEFVLGNPSIALKGPGQIVLTEQSAKKYFGDSNPLGEFLEIDELGNMEVVGVIKDPKENSIIQFDALLSFSTLIQDKNLDELYSPRLFGGDMSTELYFLFKPNFTEQEFLNEFQQFYDQYMAEFDRIQYKSIVEPIASVYLNSKIWENWSQRNKRFLFGFLSIGIFILLLACINYINMASSTALSRTKEIAIKKVLGSSKFQLIAQILLESVLLCILSLVIAFSLAEFILVFTPFNDLIGINLEIKSSNLILIFSSIILSILIGLISGILPAFFLAKVAPSKTLYGKNNGKIVNGGFRNILIAVQLIISITAVILSLLMKNQINFFLNKDLGFNKENVIVVAIGEEKVKDKIKSMNDELMQYTGVESVSLSSASPGYGHTGFAFEWENSKGNYEMHAFRQLIVDRNYFNTLNIEILKGTNFSRETSDNDTTFEFLVNEKLVETLGWDDPIGKRNKYGVVVGVVKDYNYGSLHGEVLPLYIVQRNRGLRLLNIRINGNDIENTLKHIQNIWNSYLPGVEFNYTFLDQQLEKYYKDDVRQKKLTDIFSIICIIISSLGLFSMISLANVRKIKEVAIRKVHGATVFQILMVLYKSTFYLIFIASILAIPIVLKIYSNWVNNFTYKAGFSISPYLISIFGAIFISFIISASYSLKVARSNPVNSLRYE